MLWRPPRTTPGQHVNVCIRRIFNTWFFLFLTKDAANRTLVTVMGIKKFVRRQDFIANYKTAHRGKDGRERSNLLVSPHGESTIGVDCITLALYGLGSMV